MSNPTGTRILALLFLILMTSVAWSQEVYKVVDEDGNVTYTDQPPGDGAKPMVLPELSIIGTAPADNAGSSSVDEETGKLSLGEIRRLYKDFGIIKPQDEETFWGTANEIVVSWGSTEPLQDGMTAKLIVDGDERDVEGSGSTSLTLDRGVHTLRVELFYGGRRPVITSSTVTFFVKQAALGFIDTPSYPVGH